MMASAVSASISTFRHDGFLKPFELFTLEECRVVVNHLKSIEDSHPRPWSKGLAITDHFVRNLATHPLVTSLLVSLIGKDIVLWGSRFITRPPGTVHPWHSDIESCAPNGHFVSVWIGLENICRESALQLIEGSHTFGKALQLVAYESGVRRGMVTDEMVVAWAKNLDANARMIQPDMKDGDALVFDGRIWHAGPNNRHHGDRASLLLQYASADTVIRMPDFTQLEWPFKFKSTRVPVIQVHGELQNDTNEIVRLPAMLPCYVYQLALPLSEDPERRWKAYPMFKDATPVVEVMSCHASVLSPGHMPHPPHSHDEEEILISLVGEADLIISESTSIDGAQIETLKPGSFVYYPAGQYHTIRNSGAEPIIYLMFKWRGSAPPVATSAGTRVFQFQTSIRSTEPFKTFTIFEQATAHLGKLHAHLTTVEPGAGYPPHIDGHDVAILVLSGQVETLGQIVNPFGVIYYPAGQPHGLRNVGPQQARYLVFEFHASGVGSRKGNNFGSARTARQGIAEILSRFGLLEPARRVRKIFAQSK